MGCVVDGCISASYIKGMCQKHYTRFNRYGDTQKVFMPRGEARTFFYKLISTSSMDCILWPFTTSGRDGRAWISLEGKRRGFVSRFLCEKVYGNPPSSTHQAAHNCGNAKCVNPNHLRWATPKDNAHDRIEHGTTCRGENQGASKLTEKDVREIRQLAGTLSNTEIGRIFGIGSMHVGRIIKRERWSHID